MTKIENQTKPKGIYLRTNRIGWQQKSISIKRQSNIKSSKIK